MGSQCALHGRVRLNVFFDHCQMVVTTVLIVGWQTISPQYMTYKKRMHQVEINLVDILDVDTENRFVIRILHCITSLFVGIR